MAIQVTDSAALKILEGLARQGYQEGGLRLGVKGGGCSGLNYVIRYEKESRSGDKVFERNGAKVFVDFKSLLYLKGTTLDWRGNLMRQGFTFTNPNAKRTCSCGTSFAV